MTLLIDIYRKTGANFEFDRRLPFLPIVQAALERLLGRSLAETEMRFELLDVPERGPPDGMPVMHNLLPGFGYLDITIREGESIVYKHPHPLEDIVTIPVRSYLKAKEAEQAEWGFRITTMEERPKPIVEGTIAMAPFEEDEVPPFNVRRLPEEPPPFASLGDFAITRVGKARHSVAKVLLPNRLSTDLMQNRPLSNQVEEGGFLVGHVYREREVENAYLIHITDALPAERTGASFLHLTFTGDSFTAVKETLRKERTEQRLLGWFHTHLFPATREMGLSFVDVRLHFGTFTFPWQLAGLINLDGADRKLRFYVPDSETMVQCPSWVVDE